MRRQLADLKGRSRHLLLTACAGLLPCRSALGSCRSLLLRLLLFLGLLLGMLLGAEKIRFSSHPTFKIRLPDICICGWTLLHGQGCPMAGFHLTRAPTDRWSRHTTRQAHGSTGEQLSCGDKRRDDGCRDVTWEAYMRRRRALDGEEKGARGTEAAYTCRMAVPCRAVPCRLQAQQAQQAADAF